MFYLNCEFLEVRDYFSYLSVPTIPTEAPVSTCFQWMIDWMDIGKDEWVPGMRQPRLWGENHHECKKTDSTGTEDEFWLARGSKVNTHSEIPWWEPWELHYWMWTLFCKVSESSRSPPVKMWYDKTITQAKEKVFITQESCP